MSNYSVYIRYCLLTFLVSGSSLIIAEEKMPTAQVSEVTEGAIEEFQIKKSQKSLKEEREKEDNKKEEGEKKERDISKQGDETAIETPFSSINKPDGPSLMQEGMKTIVMLLLLLVGFWWFSTWLKKSGKLARISGSNGGIECLSVYSVGQKEKIALIRVKDQELLVGITQHSIQRLHHFQSTVQPTESVKDKDAPSDPEFAKLLENTPSSS